MAQHDLVIDNASGAAVRADMNNALAALGSTMKGPNAPPAPTAGMMWWDDDTPSATIWTLKAYDGADWAELGRLNVTTNIFTPAVGNVAWADVASAATTDLSATSSNVRITGTTTITSFGTADSGLMRNLRFAAALTLTHNASSLILPGGANITTAAGDTAVAISLGSGNWVVVNYQPAVNIYAQKSYVDDGDRWVQLSSTAITAVSQIDLTWTGGAYLAYKIYILGLRPSASTASDLFMRVRRGGTFVAGASDYAVSDTWWNGTAAGVVSTTMGYSLLAQAGMAVEPFFGETNLLHADSAERIIIDSKTRHTSNSGFVGTPHSHSWFTANTGVGSGWLDGLRIGFVGGGPNFAAVGRIVVMGMKS